MLKMKLMCVCMFLAFMGCHQDEWKHCPEGTEGSESDFRVVIDGQCDKSCRIDEDCSEREQCAGYDDCGDPCNGRDSRPCSDVCIEVLGNCVGVVI